MAEQKNKKQQGEDGVTEAVEKSTAPASQPKNPEEAQAAQNVASTSGATPGAPVQSQRSEDSQKAAEHAQETQTLVGDLTHQELTRLRRAVDSALAQKGLEPERPSGPSLLEISDTLPIVEDDRDASAAAKDVDVDEGLVASWAVRQAQRPDGTGVGPKYLRVVLVDGSKHVTEV